MSRRTYTWNAFETALTSALTSGSTLAVVDSVVGLVAPIYLVVDPDDPAKREWIKVASINGNNLEGLSRNLAGSVGNVDHDPGAKVRAVFSKQLQDDIFTDLEDLAVADADHVINASDPHAAAGYLKLATADGRYLRLIGGSVTGPISLPSAAPTSANHATRKGYVDDQISGHTHPFLPLTGGALTGALAMGNNKITGLAPGTNPGDAINKQQYDDALSGGYTDAAAVAAMGALSNSNPLNHTRYGNSDVLAIAAPISHTHTTAQITSGTFQIARIPTGTSGTTVALGNHTHTYLPLSGGTITGALTVNGNLTAGGSMTVQGSARLQFQSNQTRLYNVATNRYVIIGTEAFAPGSDGDTDLGVNNLLEWRNLYTANVVTKALNGIPAANIADVVGQLVAWANGEGASVSALA